MESNERIAEIIIADFEEDDVSYKKLNEEKLLESDFIDRFLGFVEAYDKAFNTNVFDSVSKWLSYGNEEYDYIKYFLMTSHSDYSIPFTIEEFICINSKQLLVGYQKKCTKICALLDEKRALYEEFNTFYE